MANIQLILYILFCLIMIAGGHHNRLKQLTLKDLDKIKEWCDVGVEQRIGGGFDTPSRSYYFMAAFVTKTGVSATLEYECSAFFISNRHLLMARHCIHGVDGLRHKNLKEMRVKAGGSCISKNIAQGCKEKDTIFFYVEAVFYDVRHIDSKTTDRKEEIRNIQAEFAIVQLNTTVDEDLWLKVIGPVCLPSPDDEKLQEKTRLIVLGWGRKWATKPGEKKNTWIATAKLQHGSMVVDSPIRPEDQSLVSQCPDDSSLMCLYSANKKANVQTQSGDSGSPNIEVRPSNKKFIYIAHGMTITGVTLKKGAIDVPKLTVSVRLQAMLGVLCQSMSYCFDESMKHLDSPLDLQTIRTPDRA
ncbi:trypsin domain-containing protein [Ditylenchus destructor]|nr:trypsin domain-containing protein [Ditylenchus destructor]